MLTAVFLKLTNYPFFRRLLWKPIYEALAKRFTVRDWSFMNYGNTPSGGESPIILNAEDEINRFPIQLYHYLASKVDLRNKAVLEVGSGRGGGAYYLKRYLHPQSLTGLDIAGSAVKLARRHYKADGLAFTVGSAEKLPFAPGSFDVIINIESSHTYGSVPQFLVESARVLRDGGYLLLADIRVKKDMAILRRQLASCPLAVLAEENISQNVAAAMEAEEPIKQQRIKEHVPPFMHEVFRQFSGVVGSKAHQALQSGELLYYRFVLQKG